MTSKEHTWDLIAPAASSNCSRNDRCQIREGKRYTQRVSLGLGTYQSGDSRWRGNLEGGRMYSLVTPLVARPPIKLKPDRKLMSQKCVAMAERAQEALFDAWELDVQMEDMTLWVSTHVVPIKWRHQVSAHLDPIYSQLKFCRDELVRRWGLLHPPFYQPNLDAFERHLLFFQRSVQLLKSAIDECKQKLLSAEALAACRYIQLWTRRLLAKRGFYTKVIKLSYHHRGIVSGMFDSITGTSKLTVHEPADSITLEYPCSEKNWNMLNQ